MFVSPLWRWDRSFAMPTGDLWSPDSPSWNFVTNIKIVCIIFRQKINIASIAFHAVTCLYFAAIIRPHLHNKDRKDMAHKLVLTFEVCFNFSVLLWVYTTWALYMRRDWHIDQKIWKFSELLQSLKLNWNCLISHIWRDLKFSQKCCWRFCSSMTRNSFWTTWTETWSFETSATVYLLTRHNIPEELNLRSYNLFIKPERLCNCSYCVSVAFHF